MLYERYETWSRVPCWQSAEMFKVKGKGKFQPTTGHEGHEDTV